MEIPHHLVEQIRAGKAILFLGAGASWGATSTLAPKTPPSGKELGRLLSERFLGGDSTDKPLSLIGEYCIDASDLRTVQHYIAEIFTPFKPSATQKAIADFRWAALVTTNYDQIVEKAYAENTKRLQTLVPILRNVDRIDHELRAPDAVPLLKLHGCITMVDDDRYPLILTIDQYVTHRQGRQKLFSRFIEYAGEYSVVYVGYQIEDSDIRAILLELAAPELSRPMHYVVTPHPSERDTKIWAGKRITTIAGTFDEFMLTLQAKIPDGLRGFKSTAQSHPIAAKFSSHAEPSEDLLTFLANDVTYVYPGLRSEAPNAAAFFKGASYGWSAIVANFDAKRTLSDTVLSEVVLVDESDRPRVTDFYLISGYGGSGKTVLLKRIAYEAAITFEKVVLYLRPDARILLGPIAELCSLLGERLFLFVDGVARRAAEFEAFIRSARISKLALTIIVTERTNEWNVDGESLSPLLDDDHTLRSLSSVEIDDLLGKLEQCKCLGDLATKTPEQRRDAFISYADRQLLVALYEVTSGKSFPDIVFDEYRGIVSDRARRIYLVVCALNRMNVPVRAGLVYRLTGVSFNEFKEHFFGPLESIVLTEEYKPALDMAYRARHPWVAQIVFERALPTPADRFDLYVSLLKEIDIGYTPDRAAFRESIRARTLRELFSDPLMVEEIFRVANQASPDDGYLFQQHAIYEMKRANGNLERAHELISYARGLLPYDRSVTHTLSELEMARANVSKTELERHLHIDQAQQYARRLTGANAESSHGHGTLVKLALMKLRELLEKPNTTDEELTSATKEVEQALSDGLQRFRSDEHLLAAEADFSGLLHDQGRAIKALEKAIAKNPASPFVAKALSRLYEANGDIDAARKTLQDALRVLTGDKWLNGALAKLLDRHFPDEGPEAEACWRRSFTDGDTNYTSQFWFARRLYLNGKIDEALERFAKLKLARVPRQIKVSISGHVLENGTIKVFEGVIARLENDYAWVTPYGQQLSIYLHRSEVASEMWQGFRKGNQLTFGIGFNYMGPAATVRSLRPNARNSVD
jgi:tetratricopeptide (TPR) repeat protein